MFNQPMFQGPTSTSDLASCEREIENYLTQLLGKGAVEPEGYLPLALDKAKASEAFHKWLNGRRLVPGDLKKTADLSSLTSVYIPFWVVNSMTYTSYKGQRGEHYKDVEYYTANNETKSREVTKTRWTPVTGEVHHHFDSVIVCGDSTLNASEIKLILPKDVKQIQRYSPDAVQGATVEKYSVDPRACFNTARAQMGEQIKQLIGKNIGGNDFKVDKSETRHTGVSVRHVLIPAYRGVFKYKDKDYKVLINGQTGEVVGECPTSVGKVLLLVLIILLAIAAIGAAIYFFAIKPSMDKAKEPSTTQVPAVVRVAAAEDAAPADRGRAGPASRQARARRKRRIGQRPEAG
jgi:hypothetical protein